MNGKQVLRSADLSLVGDTYSTATLICSADTRAGDHIYTFGISGATSRTIRISANNPPPGNSMRPPCAPPRLSSHPSR